MNKKMRGLSDGLSDIACEYDTRHGFAAIMWEAWRRLDNSQRKEVVASLDKGPCSKHHHRPTSRVFEVTVKNLRNQRILLMTTSRRSIRAEVEGWDPIEGGWPFEPDANPTFPLSSEFLANKEVGLIGGSRGFHGYKTPLHAILDGWRLMAPPVVLFSPTKTGAGSPITEYEWWFEKL